MDLFAQDDLYDINIIGSMLKAWLRELPDELFPKDAQERIARECAGAEKVPQMLIDELSNLSPFNYYLLFAITCHPCQPSKGEVKEPGESPTISVICATILNDNDNV